jgi:hypothetical protein
MLWYQIKVDKIDRISIYFGSIIGYIRFLGVTIGVRTIPGGCPDTIRIRVKNVRYA